MKKLILMLMLLLATSCSAQNLDGGTYLPPIDSTMVAVLTAVDDKTATFITRSYARIYEVDAKPGMVKGQEYNIRVIYDGSEKPINGIRQAKLVAFEITPRQAAKNAGAFSRDL